MEKKLMNFFYDRRGDVLYISIGAPQVPISKEVGDDILILVHPDTEEVIGFTIFNFAERFSNVRELAFARMIERGLADSENKRIISNEEMIRRIRL